MSDPATASTWSVGQSGFQRVEVSPSERSPDEFEVEVYDGEGSGFILPFDRDKARELRDLLDRMLAS